VFSWVAGDGPVEKRLTCGKKKMLGYFGFLREHRAFCS